jgi:hypothetical protein
MIAFVGATVGSAAQTSWNDVVQFLQSRNGHEWLADAWLERGYWISQILLVIIALGAAIVAYRQITAQKLMATLERTAQHNWEIFHDESCKKAIDVMQHDLKVPTAPDERQLYWATRITHLSHILLIQQVWILAGKPRKLRGTYENWQKLATFVAKELRQKHPAQKPAAYTQACADLWNALHQYEETDPRFVEWMKRISD